MSRLINVYAQINKLSQQLVEARRDKNEELIEELECSIEELQSEADELSDQESRYDDHWD